MKLFAITAVPAFAAAWLMLHSLSGQADVINSGSAAPGVGRGNLPAILEKANQDANQAAKDNDPASLVKEHLSEQERVERAEAAKAAAALRLKLADDKTKARLNAVGANKDPAADEDSLGAKVKGVLAPVKDAVDAVRGQPAAATDAASKLPEPVVLLPHNDAPKASGGTSGAVNEMLWQQFKEDVKPWLIGIGVVGLAIGGTVQLLMSRRSGGGSRRGRR
ncbi:MAG: hypothetical protein RLZZ126_783 [Pseudomonadota bacterium]|jgi:hypothetical protein